MAKKKLVIKTSAQYHAERQSLLKQFPTLVEQKEYEHTIVEATMAIRRQIEWNTDKQFTTIKDYDKEIIDTVLNMSFWWKSIDEMVKEYKATEDL